MPASANIPEGFPAAHQCLESTLIFRQSQQQTSLKKPWNVSRYLESKTGQELSVRSDLVEWTRSNKWEIETERGSWHRDLDNIRVL